MTESDEIAKMLSDQLERLLIDTAGEHLEKPEAAARLLQAIEDMDLRMAFVPEEAGGAGLSPLQAREMISLLGYHAVPAGVAEAMLADWLIGLSGMEPPETPTLLATGDITLSNGRVSGTLTGLALPGANSVLTSTDAGTLVLLDRADATEEQTLTGIARETALRLTFADAPARTQGAASTVPVDMALAALRTAQIAGALTQVLDLCVEFANTREQFGRPIGKFQAIQHLVADLACETAAAQVAAGLALGGLSQPQPLGPVAAGKIRASIAAGKGAMLAHQLHGAIGVTREYVLQHLTRRLWQWRDDAGSEHHWSDRLGAEVLARGDAWQDVLDISGQRHVA